MVSADIVFIVCNLQMRESEIGRNKLAVGKRQLAVNVMFTE